MAEINASFIPKKDIKRRGGSRGFSVNIFLLIAVVIFLSAVLGSLGVYLWKQQIISEADQALETLEKNKDNYGIKAIENFIVVSNRLQASDALLQNHISVTDIFNILEQDTLTEVVISNFSFDTLNNQVLITARGSAPTYEHVAVQAEQYGKNSEIKDLILSDVDQNRDGGVSFNIAFAINTSFLNLRDKIN